MHNYENPSVRKKKDTQIREMCQINKKVTNRKMTEYIKIGNL